MCLHGIPLFQVVRISTYFIIGWVLYRCLSVIKSHSSIILWYTRRQWMLKVCSRARDHLLQAIEAWTHCQLSEGGTAGGGCYCHSDHAMHAGKGVFGVDFLIRCDVYHLFSPLSCVRYISGMLIPFSSDPFQCFQLLIKTDHCSLIIVCLKTNNGKVVSGGGVKLSL